MGEYNRALGLGATVEALGETWTVSSPASPGIRAGFEQWMEDNARKAVMPLRDDLEAYAAVMTKVIDKIVAKDYAWNTDLCKHLISETADGAAYLLYLCLKPNHPSITPRKCEDLMVSNGNDFGAVINMHIEADRKNRGLPPLLAGANGASTTSAPSSSESHSAVGPTSPSAA